MLAEDKLTKSKSRLFTSRPFYAVVVAALDYVEMSKEQGVETMATDGRHIYWNRKFVDGMTVDECMGVICHEGLHVAWLHPLRLGGRDHRIANIAQDIVINQTILEGGMTLPSLGIHGPQFDKYKGWAWEAVYDDLMKNAKTFEFSFDGGDGEPKPGEVRMWGGVLKPKNGDGKPLSQSEISELEEEIKVRVHQAVAAQKSRGNLPGGLEGLIEAVGKPKVNWRDYIQNWVSGHKPDNYSWARPNKKMFANHGVYMPRMTFNGAGTGVLSIDTSGSVSDDELRTYVREIAGMIEMCSPDRLIIIQHDAVIQKMEDWEAGEDFSSLKTKGRGGTCIAPVFKKLDELDADIDWMVCFTDGEIGDYPKVSPPFPVLWCITGPDTSPFGTYLPVKEAL